MKPSTSLFLIAASFCFYVSIAQPFEPPLFELSEYEKEYNQKNIRKKRKEQGLKSLEVSYINHPSVFSHSEMYDSLGKVIEFTSFHKNRSKDASQLSKKMKNHWLYSYDSNGSLAKASNIHEIVNGTVYGVDNTEGKKVKSGSQQKPISLPFVSAPWRLDTLIENTLFEHEYNSTENCVAQSGLAYKEPFDYHRTNRASVYNTYLLEKYRYYKYVYDNEKLVEIKEFRALETDTTLIARITFDYDELGKVVKETHVTGASTNVSALYFFEYDEEERLVERSKQFGNRTTYQYDNKGNIVQMVLHRPSGDLQAQVDITYNDKNLMVSKIVTGPFRTKKIVSFSYSYDDKGRVTKMSYGNAVCRYSYY